MWQHLLHMPAERPVLLHTRQELPARIDTDLDVAVSPHYVQRLIDRIRNNDLKIAQYIRHETTCTYWVFYNIRERAPEFLALDTAQDYRWKGCIFYSYRELADRAVARADGLLVLPPALEFGYYVIKKIGKGWLDERHAQHLSRLYRQAPDACLQELRRFLPEVAVRQIARAAATGDWTAVQRELPRLRRGLRRYMLRRYPLRLVCYYLAEAGRVLERLRRPTGLVVALLGMDGSGKSTVIREVAAALAPAFRRTRTIHLRPGRQRRGAASMAARPRHQAPRPPLISTLKLLYWVLGYGWGWIRQVWPLKVASTLVLFDRYYDDLLIDPRRYRFAGPWGLARWLRRVIPQPDLYIVLDVPAEVACRRKGEVTPAEARRLRERYRALAARLPRCHVVEAARPLDEVVAAVSRIILEFLEARTRRRLLGQA